MLKPTFRFFIIPLGAICTLASLSAQNIAPRAQRNSARCWCTSRWSIAATRSREVCVICLRACR